MWDLPQYIVCGLILKNGEQVSGVYIYKKKNNSEEWINKLPWA